MEDSESLYTEYTYTPRVLAIELPEPNRPRGLMVWNPQCEYWEFSSPFVCVNSAESTEKFRRAYSIKDYVTIFPDFKAGDLVITSSDLPCVDIFMHLKLGQQHETLPNGVYIVDVSQSGLILRPYIGAIDSYVSLPHSVEKLPDDMNIFFSKRQGYQQLGLRHKRGALVYGAPGNGKTFRIMKCASEFVSNFDCLVFTLSNSIRTLDFLQYLAPVTSGRNSIVIMEEITERVINDVQSTLRFLDGDTSWDNTYIIATTNYPEKLPANFIDRPGRFDILLEVNHPDTDSRKKYIEHFMGIVPDDIIKSTEGYSIAYLREMIIRSKLDATPLEVTLQSLKARKDKIKSKFVGDTNFGQYN